MVNTINWAKKKPYRVPVERYDDVAEWEKAMLEEIEASLIKLDNARAVGTGNPHKACRELMYDMQVQLRRLRHEIVYYHQWWKFVIAALKQYRFLTADHLRAMKTAYNPGKELAKLSARKRIMQQRKAAKERQKAKEEQRA